MTTRIYETINGEQLSAILSEVRQYHQWPLNGRRIKYVDMNFDNRTGTVFTIHFRGTSNVATFTSTNRFNAATNEMEDVRLFDEVWAWLESGRNAEPAH